MTGPDPDDAPTLLFDIDGTLVDSNYEHVVAWARAFRECGRYVERRRIHRGIGLGGGHLVDSLLEHAHTEQDGTDPDELRSRVKDLHTRYFAEQMHALRPTPGARRLLDTLARRGARVVLATSASEEELQKLRDVLAVEQWVDAVTYSGDVERTKPDPEVLCAALAKVDAGAGNAVSVGDSTWDMTASHRAGIPAIGLLCGGVSAAELTDAGAAEVFDNPAELLDDLDGSAIGRILGPAG